MTSGPSTAGTSKTFEVLRAADHDRIAALVASLDDWPGPPFASHRSAALLYHRLEFLADIGIRADDPAWPSLPGVLEKVMEAPAPEGPFRLLNSIPVAYGGSGTPTRGWALCDAPILLYDVAAMGDPGDPRVRKAAAHLGGLVRENGWPCAVSLEHGKFRGPGRKDDPCPYATLAMLKAFSAIDDLRASPEAAAGIGCLLDLWETSRERHPYMFFMGTDFRKLKAPFIWYDLLHVAEVLSRFPAARRDPRFRGMLGEIRAKAGPDGRFTPESVWTAWKDWDFGQKTAPSAWLDAFVARIAERAEASA